MNTPGRDGQRLIEVIGVFLRLGLTAFGGPAAHIGMFRKEFVEQRKWVTDEQFLDLLGATNLIPGPNSTEMAIHLGFTRAGWAGLVAGGLCFTLPAMLMVLGIAWLYVRFQSTPQLGWLLYGIKPVIIAIILQAFWELGKKAIKDAWTAGIGLAAAGLSFFNANELFLLLAGGILLMVVRNRERFFKLGRKNLPALILPALAAAPAALAPFSLGLMFLTFLKIGAILYGSGYVLVAFLRADLVTRLGWLSEKQLIDAIAVGQVTPGPLFTSATFIGYLLGGLPGGLLATLGIFLPSYILVAISNPFIPRLRGSPWAGSLLDGVIVVSLGLMAAVSLQLGAASLVDPLTVVIFLAALLALLRFKLNATWLIAAGALLGLLAKLIFT